MTRHFQLAIAFLILIYALSPAQATSPATDAAAPEKLATSALAGESPHENHWIDIISPAGPVGISENAQRAIHCADVQLSDKSGELIATPGTGVVAALSKRRDHGATNLISDQCFGDCEVRLEFLMAKGSNSGVKLQQLYEVQLYDSHGCESPTARDCGGVYPHWIFRADGKGLTYIDEGTPPITNAAKAAGEWQTLHIVFRAPRFDDDGKKIRHARFESVILNGKVVQRDVELDSPTGNASTPRAETPCGELLLQMDHGAVAFRNVRVRPL